jgi:hypothetical protein
MALLRRVKAPHLGGTREEPAAFTIEEPPEWYPLWLHKCLRQRARDTIRKSWPTAAKRAALRWERPVELSAMQAAKRQRLDESADGRAEDILTAEGGMVGTGEGEEEMPLPPGAVLDLELFSSIDWSTNTSWTVDRIKNQLKLRNLHKSRRSEQVCQLFAVAHESEQLFGRGTDLLTSGNRGPLILRLERVVKLEERASRRADDDRRRDEADAVQQARDSRARRVRRAPSHRHPCE